MSMSLRAPAKAEDPAKVIAQTIEDMTEELKKARADLVGFRLRGKPMGVPNDTATKALRCLCTPDRTPVRDVDQLRPAIAGLHSIDGVDRVDDRSDSVVGQQRLKASVNDRRRHERACNVVDQHERVVIGDHLQASHGTLLAGVAASDDCCPGH